MYTLVPPGIEPGTSRVLGERDNHYTTGPNLTDASPQPLNHCPRYVTDTVLTADVVLFEVLIHRTCASTADAQSNVIGALARRLAVFTQ